ncbi:MAG: glycosyltransferase family 39 protein, partial [Candidatus Omnitrophota bacterium]
MNSYLIYLLTNFFVLSGVYFLTFALKVERTYDRCIFVGLLVSTQIIFSELILGACGKIFLPNLILVNSLISCTLIAGVYIYSRKCNIDLARLVKQDFKALQSCLRNFTSPEIVFLSILFIFTSLWMFLAAYFYPPRDVDGIIYHLPPIYEAIQTGKLGLLPVSLRCNFAFAFSAELLFMWPAIFFHSQLYVDCVQYIYAVLGMITVFALARELGQDRKISLLLSFLFFFTPVVLFQAGTNLIEVIITAFFLISLYLAIRFYREGRLRDLYFAAWAIGLTFGMKYYMPIFAISLQFLIIPRLLKKPRKHLFLYLLCILAAGGYWYIRNYAVLGNPTYPVDILRLNAGGTAFDYTGNELKISQFIKGIFYNLYELCVHDKSLATFQGGYGLAFWGVAFPSWVFIFFKSFR